MKNFKTKLTNVCTVLTVLAEIAASVLLIYAALRKEGDIQIVLAIVAAVITVNVLAKLYDAFCR